MRQSINPRALDSRARILQAATMIFARQGFHGTSTREIARLANLSEVTLFRHYESKEELFLATLQSSLETVAKRSSFLHKISDVPQSTDTLLQIVALLHDVATYVPQAVRLIMIAYLEVHGTAEEMCTMCLGAIFKEISDCLDANMKAGQIRNLDPALTAATMAFSAIAQTGLLRLNSAQIGSRLKPQKSLDEFTTFWTDVLMSKSNSISSARGIGLPLLNEAMVTVRTAEA